MTIYIDVVLIENLIMNYIILLATGVILKTKIKHFKIIMSSLIGAIYTILAYVITIPIYSSFFMKFLLSIIIIYVAYNPQNVKKMWKILIVFYLTSFVFGGAAFALIYIVKPQDILMKNGLFLGTYPMKSVVLAGIIGFIIIVTAFKIVRNRITKRDIYKNVKIEIDGKQIHLNAILDTGNMLKDPITGSPVIVVEKSILYEILPIELLDNIENILGGNLEKIPESIKKQYIKRLKFIPFSSLGRQNGMLVGIKPNFIEIMDEQNSLKREDIIIGIYEKSLTKDGRYRALMGIV
ncbi:MAG: sigma-E processing peptidase SpoIIGA [Clostridia bacterium]|nr:sigma-E processing peptidase SpoIIGA [Clostridia bacterium]